MKQILRLRWVAACAAAVLLFADPSFAQSTGTVRGTVTAGRSLRPLAGAQVVVVGTGRGSLTGSSGEFLIPGVPAGTHTIRVQMIGYGSDEETVSVAEGAAAQVEFVLNESAIALDEVVVTGAGVVTERKRLGQVVTSLNAERLENAPVANITEALQGRVAGVTGTGLGETGSAAPIRMRGSVSLSQRNGPLLYVDGIRIDNEGSEFASLYTNRLNDINPENIERIEILKGAAAATLYGTEASAGVIQIFTKKGQVGPPRWDFKMRQGAAQTDASRIPANVVYDAESGQLMSNAPAEDFLRVGHIQEYTLSASGGAEQVKYFASGWLRDENGTLPTNSLENMGGRVNLSFTPTEKTTTVFTMEMLRNNVSAPYPTWGLVGEFVLADPRRVDEQRPYGELFHTIAGAIAYQNSQKTDVRTVSGEVTYAWMDGLTSRAVVGYNESGMEAVLFVPPGPDLRTPRGLRSVRDRTNSATTLDASTAWDLQLRPNLTSSLIVGGQSFWEQRQNNFSEVRDFPAAELGTLRGGSTVTDVDEFYEEVINAGIFAQEQIGINDRLFITAGVRMDGNSAFGEDFGFQTYPKLGASWTVSEEPFWSMSFLDLFRLRAAYGTSGLQPGAYDALRTWRVQPLLENISTVAPQSFGNRDLRPERSTEIEVGGDLGLLDNRLGLELTGFWQRTDDAILARERAPSEGFLSPQLVNIGELQSKGIEAAVSFSAIESSNLSLQFNGTFATLDQEVTDLADVPGFKTSSDTRRWNFVREGYQPGAVIAPIADPSQPYRLTVPVEELTALNQIAAQTLKTASGQDSLVFIGNQLPTYNGSLAATLSLPRANLRFNTLVSGAGGFVVFNETELIRTQVALTDRTARFTQELANPATTAQRRQEIAAAYASLHPQLHSTFVEDGDYLRLQELSLTWEVGERFMERVPAMNNLSLTLAGRNLLLFSGYSGIIDPGTSSTTENDFGLNVDYFGAPNPRRFELTLQTSF